MIGLDASVLLILSQIQSDTLKTTPPTPPSIEGGASENLLMRSPPLLLKGG